MTKPAWAQVLDALTQLGMSQTMTLGALRDLARSIAQQGGADPAARLASARQLLQQLDEVAQQAQQGAHGWASLASWPAALGTKYDLALHGCCSCSQGSCASAACAPHAQPCTAGCDEAPFLGVSLHFMAAAAANTAEALQVSLRTTCPSLACSAHDRAAKRMARPLLSITRADLLLSIT